MASVSSNPTTQVSGDFLSVSDTATKPVWNKPNGVMEVGPVMGAMSWPALSDSAKASPKIPNVSVPPSQGTDIVASSSLTSTPNHQRSNRRSGGASANGIVPRRDNVHRDGVQRGGFVSQSLSGNEQQHIRNSPRKSNTRSRPRGDGGSYHHDTRLHPPRVPSMPFLQAPPPPPSPPFIPPLMPMHPLGSPIGYPEVPPPVYYVPGPMLPPPGPPMFYNAPDPVLLAKIVKQIEYYFSTENLVKDMYLRKEMDDQGWVPIKLIASFNKVSELIGDIQLIQHAVRTSTVVEVQGEKLRPRNNWIRWILPPSMKYSLSSPQKIETFL